MQRNNPNNLLYSTVFVVCLITLTIPTYAFKFGDIVRFSHRLYSNNKATQWNENLSKYCPRFGYERTFVFNIADMNDKEKKISLAFEDEKFSTSWIQLSDGKGTYLSEIDFTFLYSHNNIREMKWRTGHVFEDNAPEKITISYNWVEVGDKDLTNGIGFLLISGLILSSVLLIYSIAKTQSTFEEKRAHPERKPPSFYTDTANYSSTHRSDASKNFISLNSSTDEVEFENFFGGGASTSFPFYKPNDTKK
eukprot:TRINITY_DN5259_c0_g1_i1.p1 TRINITY_DN5259_c0_g1~~TRINITY_DN5259_c0_g1_i1.p1  ORF type:complete len:250 (-),score=32.66 TRINITY_DN5259_c0_g1_i1:43-792(-)